MISCWGIHHLDIAQWGNGTDNTGPVSVEGIGEYPAPGGGCDAVLSWKIRFEYAQAAPVTFVNDNRDGMSTGVRFVGEDGWVHVLRGKISASSDKILQDPASKVGTMPIKLPVSIEHTRNFVDAVKNGTRAICDIETAVRSDTLRKEITSLLKTLHDTLLHRRVRFHRSGIRFPIRHRPFEEGSNGSRHGRVHDPEMIQRHPYGPKTTAVFQSAKAIDEYSASSSDVIARAHQCENGLTLIIESSGEFGALTSAAIFAKSISGDEEFDERQTFTRGGELGFGFGSHWATEF
jgi:hypothetical protein